MKIIRTLLSFVILTSIGCSTLEKQSKLNQTIKSSDLHSIEGKPQYLTSPFVTAGDRLYMIGYQDGSFPDLGWHIGGEMGGIWDHPVKLMSGFSANISIPGSNDSYCLDKADMFINYPMANSHHFSWRKENVEVWRSQFVPDGTEGIAVEFTIINTGEKEKEIIFSFTGMTDLRPTWLGERTKMIDSDDEHYFDRKLSAVIAKDKNNPWFVAFGSSQKNGQFSSTPATCQSAIKKNMGRNGTLSYTIKLKAGEEKSIPIFIAGSYQSKELLLANYHSIQSDCKEKLAQKIDRYKKIDARSCLKIPDKDIQQMYEWLKYNTDWLIRNVPEQGTGLSAGLPDYPWWFGADASYSLQGVLATGDHELARNTILLLHNASSRTNNNGRIIHEVSTNGSVYNPGNVNETAQFISLLGTYFAWTGDKELITQLYPDVKMGLKWLLEEMDPDRNSYPNGSGMMEIQGLNTEMIDVAVYTQQALVSAAGIAYALDDLTASSDYQKKADALKVRINNDWWNKSAGSYGDFRGTPAESFPILNAAIVRADTLGKPWAVSELKETASRIRKYSADKKAPMVIYHNWVVNTPMETGVADPEKGKIGLITASKYENPFGVYVTGIDRTEEPDSIVLKSRKKIFSYTGAVMTLPTGVTAVAAANYGSPEDVLRYLNMLKRSFSYALPGSMYEVSPDFGMVTQAWNIYGVAVPIINHFFGIHPDAYNKTIYISAHMPSAWGDASLDNIRVGKNSISLAINTKNGHTEYMIKQTMPDWNIVLDISDASKVIVNNVEVKPDLYADRKLRLTGGKLVVEKY